MAAWLYWLLAAGYLVTGGLTMRAVRGRFRWFALAGTSVIGAILLLPVSCRSLVMSMCVSRSTPPECDNSSDHCSTLVGLSVPYTDTLGVPATYVLGIGLVLAGVGAGLAVARPGTGSRRGSVPARILNRVR